MKKIAIALFLIFVDIYVSFSGVFPFRNFWWVNPFAVHAGFDILPDIAGYILIFFEIRYISNFLYPENRFVELSKKTIIMAGGISVLQICLQLPEYGIIPVFILRIANVAGVIGLISVVLCIVLTVFEVEKVTGTKLRSVELVFAFSVYVVTVILMGITDYGKAFTITLVLSPLVLASILYIMYILWEMDKRLSNLEL